MYLTPTTRGSRKLLKSHPHRPTYLATACMPYGMREVEGFGEGVWEFFNRQYEVIGAPFRFMEPLSNDFLASVSCDGSTVNSHAEPGRRLVVFGSLSGDRELNTLRRVAKVMSLPIETEIESVVQLLPTTWDIPVREKIECWSRDAY